MTLKEIPARKPKVTREGGIYVLMKGKSPVYFGGTNNFERRAKQHKKKFPDCEFYILHVFDGPVYERLVLEASYQLHYLGKVRLNRFDAICWLRSIKKELRI